MKVGDKLICKKDYENSYNVVSFEIGKTYTIFGYNELYIVWIDSGTDHEYFSIKDYMTIDLDKIPVYKKSGKINKFSGKRISRGMYKTDNGRNINADVNGSYNILRKAIPNAFADGIEGVGVHPEIITISK